MSENAHWTPAETGFSHGNGAEEKQASDAQSDCDLEALQFQRSEARRRVHERMYAERMHRSTRPLQGLVGAEAAIQQRADATMILTNPKPRLVDQTLLTRQLTEMVNVGSPSRNRELKNDTIRLYASLESRNPTESILNRLQVMMLVSVAECHARAARTTNAKAIDVNLRHAVNGTNAIVKLIEAVESRHKTKQVMIGGVNVEAGGQAMVGNFQTQEHRRRKSKKTRALTNMGKE